MTINLNSIMIGTTRPAVLVDFYTKVMSKPPDFTSEEGGVWGWATGGTYFSILRHSEMGGQAKDPARVMLNFETGQVQEEFDRIKAAGAGVIREPYGMEGGWIATLSDPDGNYFQLMTPMPM